MLKPSPIQRFIDLVRDCFAFKADDGQTFIQVPIPPGCNLPVRSPDFRDWFFFRVYAECDTVPTTNAFHAILNLLEAKGSIEDFRRIHVSLRVAYRGPALIPSQVLLDLANDQGQFVEISAGGWKTTIANNAFFQTFRSTVDLPAPKAAPAESPRPLASPAPALEILRSLLNLPSRNAWLSCLAWLLSTLRPCGPYPFLILQGPPGCGKTLAARILRCLIDPSTAPLSPIPATARDLLLLARHIGSSPSTTFPPSPRP